MKYVDDTSLFSTDYRASGVMLDIAALPSPYGVGDVGPVALKWIDRLRESGQSCWHALESGKTGYCDSAYQCYSSFSGNVLLISPDWMIADGLLTRRDCDCVSFPSDMIDYDVVVPFKHWLLEKAWKNFNRGSHRELLRLYEQFRKKQCHWLEDYALFEALKARYRGTHCLEWPARFVRREQDAIDNARHELAMEIDRVRFSQFLLFRQSQRLKDYAQAKGVSLIGDMSYEVSDDSSEAWANPELFVRDDNEAKSSHRSLIPIWFSSGGRLGPDHNNQPVHDSGVISRVSHRWCADRLRALFAHVDVCRVDVALTAPPHAAAGAPVTLDTEARGIRFLNEAGLIAHDLRLRGSEPAKVLETRVLQSAFDGRADNPHLPQNYERNSVVYTGLHDDARTRQWFEALPDQERQTVWTYLNRPAGETSEIAWELIRLAWSSKAALSIATVSDLLNLETSPNQTNAEDHRRWRCSEEMLEAPAFYRLRELTSTSDRSSEVKKIAEPAVLRPPRRRPRIQAAL